MNTPVLRGTWWGLGLATPRIGSRHAEEADLRDLIVGFRVASDYEYSWVHGKCVRSGSWTSDTSALCAATRGAYEPDINPPFGFRLVCEDLE